MIENRLYKITQGNKYIILTTGSRWGLNLDGEDNGVDAGLYLKFRALLNEVEKHEYEDEEISKIFAVHPDAPSKFLADNFLNWVRKSHPEIGEFKAKYIGKDVSWWFKQDEFGKIQVPDFVKVTEDGHWIDKKTGKNLDELKEDLDVGIVF